MSIATAKAMSTDKCVMKQISTFIIDNSAIFYVIPWSVIVDLVIKFRNYIEKQLKSYDVYLVLDTLYREFCTKVVKGDLHGAQLIHVYQLTTVLSIPPQKVIITVLENKRQIISHIINYLCNTVFHVTSSMRTEDDPVPAE